MARYEIDYSVTLVSTGTTITDTLICWYEQDDLTVDEARKNIVMKHLKGAIYENPSLGTYGSEIPYVVLREV